MALHNLAAQVESHAGSLGCGLGGEEGVENLPDDGFLDANAVVADAHFDDITLTDDIQGNLWHIGLTRLFSVQFLGNYSVSQDVQNLLTITSYVDTLLMLCLVFGIVFELPVLAWLLAKAGMLRAEWMTRYRRHSVVAILIVAALITPTADALTLVIVALPIWLLYEVSVMVVKTTQ